ncbi:MAG: phosphoenolpyruvate--protein phosphotransferase [Reyranella sp.]|uniref:phosphoenolpyruvate--protein phosphotransferase n=1 Tax=Reyranella sp. TaxID=1929291 RepID=UPI001ACD77C0|nr:phosphoenolpyruvate--protein phosphotransferase [Reyranella sp.]MBN9540921.1 phosphoenolpyruvate--protein phosphotransferase [Alphaproteobacteria bacterium]MBR2814202.1 phosphoenolpyruvate--protein phosphotransferase [Reyranella sp.]
MARAESAEATLAEVVRLVANELVAEVCSIYLLRAGEVLELFATQGLNPSAVHRTRLRVGEGLVGDIAAHGRAMALADAQAHPQFAYRPETGEEIYHSLAGVPIVRAGRVLGVLVVQNRTRRQYDEEEVETLQTIAMVLAELVSAGNIVSPNEVQQVDGLGLLPLRVDGVQLTPGVSIGRAVLHEPRIVIQRVVAEDTAQEQQRFQDAVHGVREDVDRMLEAHDMQSGEQREILETFRMFVDDRGWMERVREAIVSGLTAEAGVQRAFDDVRARLGQSTDPYIRERLSDLQDLSNRLLLRLTGRVAVDPASLPDDMIVVARDMGPAELLDYDRTRLRGVVLEEGSALSHVAIVARALDIPVVGRAPDVLSRVEAGDSIVVDGDNAQVLVRPAEDVLQGVYAAIEARTERRRKYAALRDLPSVTRNQAPISLHMNAGLLIDMQHLHDTGADGVGLYRTEIPFMVRSEFPDVDAQAWLYGRVLDLADGRPVTFRTLDVGGDKVLPYVGAFGDENPAMGWRAIRIGLDRPAMLRGQLRALVQAANGRPLSIMFPMIADVGELMSARKLLELELDRAKRRGVTLPERLRVGVMFEVPALAWQLDSLLPHVDFLSVGTNDLLQFLFAADRGNSRLAGRYDSLSPALLRLLHFVVEKTRPAGVDLAVCGEMAGRPVEALALLAVGVRNLSMSPGAIGPVKAMIRSLDLGGATGFMTSALSQPDRPLRETLRLFAADHAIEI